jgi:hypothetical protein
MMVAGALRLLLESEHSSALCLATEPTTPVGFLHAIIVDAAMDCRPLWAVTGANSSLASLRRKPSHGQAPLIRSSRF